MLSSKFHALHENVFMDEIVRLGGSGISTPPLLPIWDRGVLLSLRTPAYSFPRSRYRHTTLHNVSNGLQLLIAATPRCLPAGVRVWAGRMGGLPFSPPPE